MIRVGPFVFVRACKKMLHGDKFSMVETTYYAIPGGGKAPRGVIERFAKENGYKITDL